MRVKMPRKGQGINSEATARQTKAYLGLAATLRETRELGRPAAIALSWPFPNFVHLSKNRALSLTNI